MTDATWTCPLCSKVSSVFEVQAVTSEMFWVTEVTTDPNNMVEGDQVVCPMCEKIVDHTGKSIADQSFRSIKGEDGEKVDAKKIRDAIEDTLLTLGSEGSVVWYADGSRSTVLRMVRIKDLLHRARPEIDKLDALLKEKSRLGKGKARLYGENFRLKDQIKTLQEQNEDLKTKIRLLVEATRRLTKTVEQLGGVV